MLNIYVGYDPREAAVYHVFCQSVIERSSGPVSFSPLHKGMLGGFDGQQDGSNAFIYSRYLVPYLCGYRGWAMFFDGDMLVMDDIYKLASLRDPSKAIQCVHHNYKTRSPRKYIGTDMESSNVDYPRKNFSSVMLINCEHPSNKCLTPEFVAEAGGAFLHRFEWLKDDELGELPIEWNWLEGEYEHNPDARLVHHTLGSPGFEYYAESDTSKEWNRCLLDALYMSGERQSEMVRRAHWHRSVPTEELPPSGSPCIASEVRCSSR